MPGIKELRESKGRPVKACARCLLDERFPGLTFDPAGVCSCCAAFEPLRARLSDREGLKALFLRRVARFRGRGRYDCLLGVSGGKDSAYVLYMLRHEYKLNVLAYTFDNNFLSDAARENIKKLTSALGVDHFFHKPDGDFHRALYRHMLAAHGVPCKACSIGAYGTSFKFAAERRIPAVIHGRSPAQMFRDYRPGSADPTTPLIENNLAEYGRLRQLSALRAVLAKTRGLAPTSTTGGKALLSRMRREFLPGPLTLLAAGGVPEFLGFFLYHDYDEEFIKSFLRERLGWRPPGADGELAHPDCLIHDAVEYLRRGSTGHTMLTAELSVLVRLGRLSRAEAAARLAAAEAALGRPRESLDRLAGALGLDPASL